MKKYKFMTILAFTGIFALSQGVFAQNLILDEGLDISPIHLASEDPGLKAKVEEKKEKHGILEGFAEKGITIEIGHTNDTGMNFGGLISKSTKLKSMSLLDMSATFDTEKMGLWKGGTAYILGQTIYGKGLSGSKLGDIQGISSIEGPARTQLSEYWYEQKLFKNKFRVATGKGDAAGEFNLIPMAEDYLGASYTLMPNIPMPSYPDQALGVWGEIAPTEWFNVKSGIYDGGASGRELGFRTGLKGRDGYITLVQGEVKPNIKGHDGNYIFGWWTHSNDLDNIETSDIERRSGNYGLYTAFQQMMWKEKDTEDQGLSLMGQFSWAPSDRNEITRYFGAGCTYKGLIPKRNEDVLGAGMALANLSKRHKLINELQNEAAFEFFYKLVLNDYLTLQPDFQVILHSGGGNQTAYALGLRTIISIGPKTPEKL